MAARRRRAPAACLGCGFRAWGFCQHARVRGFGHEENRHRLGAAPRRIRLSAALRPAVPRARAPCARRGGRPDPVRRQPAAAASGQLVQPASLAHRGGRVRLDRRRRGRAGHRCRGGSAARGRLRGVKAGEADGHHLQNRSGRTAVLLAIGSRRPGQDIAHYPDIDLRWSEADGDTHKDGTPY